MTLNESRFLEESIGRGNGSAIHAKLTSQFASSGQPLTPMQRSLFNGERNCIRNLAVRRRVRRLINGDLREASQEN